MPIDIRTYLDSLLNSHCISRESADCIYQEYARLKDHYLAGKLDKSALEAMQAMRAEQEKIRAHQSNNLPSIEDLVLFTMAENICKKESIGQREL
jgi:hypothetical protein